MQMKFSSGTRLPGLSAGACSALPELLVPRAQEVGLPHPPGWQILNPGNSCSFFVSLGVSPYTCHRQQTLTGAGMRKREKAFRALWATTVTLYLVALPNTHLPDAYQSRAPMTNLARFMMLRDARKRESLRAVAKRARRQVVLHWRER
jgi:hypothetical protein